MIGELLGKTKERDEETFVFTEEGNKKEIMTYTKEYTEEWKKSVYQKTDRIDFTFWYGNDTIKGWKTEMEEDLKNGDSGIMVTPIITIKEMIEVVT